MSLRELIVASPLGCVGMLLLGGVFSALFGMASIFARQTGLSIAEVSLFVTAIYLGGLVLQYPVGWLSDRVDRRLLIVVSAGLCAAVALAGLWAGNSIVFLCLTAFLVGGTTNPLYSLLIAHTNDFLYTEQMPSASGGLLFINGIGAMGGPVLVGLLMNQLGNSAFFAYIATLMAGVCAYGIYRMTQRAAVSVDETAPYIPLTSRSTQVAAEIAIEAIDDMETDAADAEASEEPPQSR